MSQYHSQFYASICCGSFNANTYSREVLKEMQKGFDPEQRKSLHLEWYAEGKNKDYCQASFSGEQPEPEIQRAMESLQEDLAVTLKASSDCPAEELAQVIEAALEKISPAYHLSRTVFSVEYF